MKKIILFSGIMALAALVQSCENPVSDDGQKADLNAIRISVIDEGFSFSGNAGSYYAREFKTGDRIGIFAVKDGSFVEGQSNICYVAESDGLGGIVWSAAGDYGTFFSDARYYAYYPYDEGLSFSADFAAQDAAAFFADMITGHHPAGDQSEEAFFDSSDLMVGSAMISEGNKADFSMMHAMSLIVIELPVEYYAFGNTDYDIPDYVLNSYDNADFDGFMPFPEGYGFLYLVKPGTSVDLSGSYTDKDGNMREWNDSIDPDRGTCSIVSIDGGESSIDHTLSIGDFFLADGRILPKDASTSEVTAADVIGIVFQIDPDRIDPTIADTLGSVHALVMSSKCVKNAPDGGAGLYHWSETGLDETLIGFTNVYAGYDLEANYRMSDRDIYGYKYTNAIKSQRSDRFLAGEYPLFTAVDAFSDIAGGPSNEAPETTGWYVPSIGEWLDAVRGLSGLPLVPDETMESATDGPGQFFWSGKGNVIDMMNVSLEKVSPENKDDFFEGGALWTSSVADTDAARNISFNSEGYIFCRWSWKDLGLYARAVLAF